MNYYISIARVAISSLLLSVPMLIRSQELRDFKAKSYLMETHTNQAAAMPIKKVIGQEEAQYTSTIRDVLGEHFQTEEDLNVTIGRSNLKYNISKAKKSVTLEFGTDQEGTYSYNVYGFFRHIDGSRYALSGKGTIKVTDGACFDLFLLRLDPNTKTATVYLGACTN